jgi:hypothetical protein
MDDIFQAGAALRSGKLYVERSADAELFESLARAEFCHVLAPRQIGKTSLCHRAMRRLEAQGARCALIEVLSMGTKTASVEQWYRTFAERLASQLKLSLDLSAFWQKHSDKTPVERFTQLIREEAAPREGSPVVIVVDEIDALLSRPLLGDEFFGAVRAFANARAQTPAYEHLSFCLVGVCAPTDLVSDKLVTPYNIASRAIRLEDFSRAELDAFAGHLAGTETEGDPRALLDAIFHFTEGHPYMTQSLLVRLTARDRAFTSIPPLSPREEAEARPPLTEEERVKALVDGKFLNPEDGRDPNLAYAEERFKAYEGGPDGAAILRLYRRLIEGERIAAKSDNPSQMALRLTGMAAERRDGEGIVLRVRNPIFASVFDRAWVKEREAKRLVTDPLTRWQENGRRDDFLPEGEALSAALSWAKASDDLSPEECRFLVAAVERAGDRRLEHTELTKTVDLERSLRARAEIESESVGLVSKIRDQLGRERQRTLLALVTAVLMLTGGLTIYWIESDALQKLEASMAADQKALQATLTRQKEEFDSSSKELDEKLKAAKAEAKERDREAAEAKSRAEELEKNAAELQAAADQATANKADMQRMAERARKAADEANSTAEETKGLAAAAKQSEQAMGQRYEIVKRQAEDAERRAAEAIASAKRTKELADAAVQAEREARLKAEADLTAERAISDSERKLRVKAEAENRMTKAAQERVERGFYEKPASMSPKGTSPKRAPWNGGSVQ